MIVSDLPRTMETAALAGLDAVPDPAWREIDIGRWQGLTRDEVVERYPEESAAWSSGEPIAMGGGESWPGFSARVERALDALVESTPHGSRVLVVTHGGNVHAVMGNRLGFGPGARPWPLERVRNASITQTVVAGDRFHLQTYNDARHAGSLPDGAGTLMLVRHAETEANRSGQWHGRTDGPLSDHGRVQAAAAASALPPASRILSSPLERTRTTAAAYAARLGLEVQLESDLIEIDFGTWEGLTTSEIQERFADEWHRVFEEGRDDPRGGSGETFEAAGSRMQAVVERVAEVVGAERAALFTHGGAIWTLAGRVLGLRWPEQRLLDIPGNTSITHVQRIDGRLRLVDYNLSAT